MAKYFLYLPPIQSFIHLVCDSDMLGDLVDCGYIIANKRDKFPALWGLYSCCGVKTAQVNNYLGKILRLNDKGHE